MTKFRAFDGILLRSIVATGLSFVLIAIATVAYTVVNTRKEAEAQSQIRLEQLLDTVQSTLRVACFVKDKALAREVASGLLGNNEVLHVSIRENDEILADLRRKDAPPLTNEASLPGKLQRAITSPFGIEVIGQIELTPNPAVIDAHIHHEVLDRTIQLAWQLALISGAMVVTLLALVIHPISAMSRHLHAMDPTRGDRLPIPSGHAHTEIGRLADDVNALAGKLVRALDEEHALRLQQEVDERKYHAIFDNAGSGIFIVDRQGNMSAWNNAMARLLGIPANDVEPGPLNLSALHGHDPAEIERLLAAVLSTHAPVTLDLPIRRADRTPFWLNIALSPVGPDILQGIAHDVSELKEAEAQARRQAVTDPLTGLANRAGLERRLQENIEPSRCSGKDFALLHVDIDQFRLITEGLGLPAGDEILRAVASRLSAHLKSNDTLARLSADIFAIALESATHAAEVDDVVEGIMTALRQPYLVNGSPVPLTASVGIAIYPSDGKDAPSLLRHAELAADKAKAGGGDRAVFFDPTLAESAERRRDLENDLRQAVRERQFVLYYQAIVDVPANRLAGAEALIRWRHPQHGLVPPDRFIPVLEQTGLINEVGLWVLDAACAQLADWQTVGAGAYYLSINVSGRQIPGGLPPAAIRAALARHDVAPERLVIEITEGILLNNIAEAQAWLQAVQALGIRVYLDDFGTGYSSLSYLKRFPLDTLKIDRSFVQDMQPGNSEHSLVEAIVAMARSLGLNVVAEGVESELHLNMLRSLGCQYAQGYYLSRPMPADEFLAAVERVGELLAAPVPVT